MHDRLKVTFKLDLERGALHHPVIAAQEVDQFSEGESTPLPHSDNLRIELTFATI